MAILNAKPTSILAGSLESWAYLDSYTDLQIVAKANGTPLTTSIVAADSAWAAAHYNTFGKTEVRSITFDAAEYLASNADLIKAFGPLATGNTYLQAELLASQHYFQYGYAETGRPKSTTSTGAFNPTTYLSQNADLATAYGYTVGATITDAQAALAEQHYVTFGYVESRPGTGFTGTTYSLTTGLDQFTGSGTYTAGDVAGVATWTSGDSIAASGSANVFNVIQGTLITGNPAASTVTGVQTANITGGLGIGTVTALDTSAWTGLTTLSLTSPGIVNAKAAATTDVTVTDSVLGASAITVNGGKTVTVTDSTTIAGTVTVGATTASAGAVNINHTLAATGAQAGGAIAITGGTIDTVKETLTQATAGTTSQAAQ